MTAVGLNLHVQSTISDTPISEVIRGILPFLTGLLIVPGMNLWPPHHVYGQSY